MFTHVHIPPHFNTLKHEYKSYMIVLLFLNLLLIYNNAIWITKSEITYITKRFVILSYTTQNILGTYWNFESSEKYN